MKNVQQTRTKKSSDRLRREARRKQETRAGLLSLAGRLHSLFAFVPGTYEQAPATTWNSTAILLITLADLLRCGEDPADEGECREAINRALSILWDASVPIGQRRLARRDHAVAKAVAQ